MKNLSLPVEVFLVSVVTFAAVVSFAAQPTKEVLVLASAPKLMPRNRTAHGFEIQNRGPHSIDCGIGSNQQDAGAPVYADGGQIVVTGHAREIKTDGVWSGDTPGDIPIWCIADTADQVAGAATILTDAP